MLEFFQRLFSSADFMPHGHCYFWRPEVLWLHVISDGLIALAYFSIPLALVYLVRKRDDLPFPWLFWLFGIFIVACGTTHIFSIISIWHPYYRLEGVIKAITALASLGTAAALIPIIPKALGLASPEKLLQANLMLEKEIAARREAETSLAAANREMEERVRERTAELADTVNRLRESEGGLHVAKDEAERANAAKSEFLSRMSHELRTPLNAVLGFGQLLELNAAEEDAASVQQILKAGRHLLGLIDEVLDISRLETGRLELTLEPLSVCELVHDAIRLLEPLARPHEIHLSADECAADLYVLADRLRLHQSLLNLVANAVKFNRDGGHVRVSAESRDGCVRVRVRDSGSGIREADLPKLFSAFERLDANDRNISGSGIGLALTKGLIESQGGTVGVESKVGEGSTFWIDLPVPAEVPVRPVASECAGKEAPPVAAAPAPHRRTLLYIEDNVDNCVLVESALRRVPDLKVIAAMQGALGVEMAREHRPELILLDLQLPDIMGDEVLRRLRADEATRNTPIVMLSGFATPTQIDRLLATGATTYMAKPLDLPKFLAVVKELLDANVAP